jgi:hypothetical protein
MIVDDEIDVVRVLKMYLEKKAFKLTLLLMPTWHCNISEMNFRHLTHIHLT